MDSLKVALAIAILLGGGASAATSTPFSNTALDDNEAGWFTVDNLDAYGDDFDRRIDGSATVLSGHPAYVMDSDDARLLFDMPRMHYYYLTFMDTDLGQEFQTRLIEAIHTGQAEYAIDNSMTTAMLEQNRTLAKAFRSHYCLVDDAETRALYNRTDATLYRWVENESACPPERRATGEWWRDEV